MTVALGVEVSNRCWGAWAVVLSVAAVHLALENHVEDQELGQSGGPDVRETEALGHKSCEAEWVAEA